MNNNNNQKRLIKYKKVHSKVDCYIKFKKPSKNKKFILKQKVNIIALIKSYTYIIFYILFNIYFIFYIFKENFDDMNE